MTKRSINRSSWWDLIAQSVGLYFPVRRSIIVAYVFFIVGVSVTAFVFVGANLMRTLDCDMTLLHMFVSYWQGWQNEKGNVCAMS
jgi:hypothetical protein